ncbi:hypothetical protein K432DRAFT_424148 [Lepidopterella palustris CBS 459.81]|uniref:Sodium/calcium exchanger membrane region domain-containing protein n=1 Tax=Lepidopterella palustris CBS 459.81 TaxID=1314670 RepID=A0A8E2JH53_9PEZI|nr:hypothetical protein K432DRAFT_424148 [Lepidopterella palustris CBS 459.81]
MIPISPDKPAARWSPRTSMHGLHPRRKYSARPFILTIAVIVAISLLSVASDRIYSDHSSGRFSPRGLHRREHSLFEPDNEECRLVHHAPDKCAFVKANCPDEEAGIFSYLTLYYCRLPHVKPIAFIILVLWLALLFSTIGIAASDFFCVNLSTIAALLGMSESMAGVTFLALGNGSPDVFSTFAAMSTNSGSLAVGELMGAAGFITAVVAGSMALVRPFKVARKSFVRDVGFFIVAASFSMVFLWDGKLYLWECATMVGFYMFYVVVVMVWHWWLGRRRRQRQRTATIRSHYIMPGGDEAEIPEEYHDDEDAPTGSHTPLRGISTDDFSELERSGGGGILDLDDDEEEEVRERWLGELSSNMRLSKPRMGERRNTLTPIRPSLVGALEFRAVLASLKKSRNIQSIPINLRRYSDDPVFTTAQQQDNLSTVSDPASRPPYQVIPKISDPSLEVSRPKLEVRRAAGYRGRAVSTNDVDGACLDPNILKQGAVPSIDLLAPLPEDDARTSRNSTDQPPPSPSFSLSPPLSEHESRGTSPAAQRLELPSPNRLAPPEPDVPGARSNRQGVFSPSPLSSPTLDDDAQVGSRPHQNLKLTIPGASPPSPFPAYSDFPFSARSSSRAPSLRLPPPSASPESLYHDGHFMGPEKDGRPLRWWPYSVLPAPRVLISTLFPTLYSWHDKNIWEKFLGVIAAPSVFLLTITLPVVETQKDDDNEKGGMPPSLSLPGPLTLIGNDTNCQQRSTITILEPEPPPTNTNDVPRNTLSLDSARHKGLTGSGGSASVATSMEQHYQPLNHPEQILLSPTPRLLQSPEQLPTDHSSSSESKQWNRWLAILQAFTAPYFIVVIVWANTSLDSPRALLKPSLYSLLVSLCMLAILLFTTTPTRPPRWRVVLCFLGFAVSISWISSIANEVVGVLKTLGVILNMSDAILGLTIFAVGNSLGDLVADITVARLGFPVMALSACFGGPMLNILLGIGVSGCYMTIKGGKHHHEKHPDLPMQFKPYHIDVNTTLVISGATLLVTLVGLLVAVPTRKWKMDKTIGWGLVVLWFISTVGNVIVEITGWGGSVS